MNKEELIKAVNEGAMFTEEGDRVLYEQQVIDLIEQSLSGHVIVPEAAIKNFAAISREMLKVDGRENWADSSPVYRCENKVITIGDCKAMLSAAKGE